VVCKLDGEEEYAVGWNDYHFKTFVTTGGTTEAGRDAKRKRQTETGQTYYKDVKRPKVVADYYDACGEIDLHNNFRQGHLRLEKFHKTKKWNSRVLTSILASTTVGAFRAWEFHFPPGPQGDVVASRLKSFVARVIDEINPGPPANTPTNLITPGGCSLVLIGKRTGKEGTKRAGQELTAQERCKMCHARGRLPDNGGLQELHAFVKNTPVCGYVTPIKTHG